MSMKKCPGPCGQEYPATTEYFHVKGKGKLKSRCKDCFNLVQRDRYRKSNPGGKEGENNKSIGAKRRWANTTPEEKEAIFAKAKKTMPESAKKRWANATTEEIQASSDRTKKYWDSLSPGERALRGRKVSEGRKNKKSEK